MNLDKKIDYSIALLRKAESMALRLDPENGFYLAFSGGKDSQALYHIAQMAGVKFKAHMNLTSVDPPEVIRFVKRNWMKTIEWLMTNKWTDIRWDNPEQAFNWWISGKPFAKFYADEVLQQRFDFDL